MYNSDGVDVVINGSSPSTLSQMEHISGVSVYDDGITSVPELVSSVKLHSAAVLGILGKGLDTSIVESTSSCEDAVVGSLLSLCDNTSTITSQQQQQQQHYPLSGWFFPMPSSITSTYHFPITRPNNNKINRGISGDKGNGVGVSVGGGGASLRHILLGWRPDAVVPPQTLPLSPIQRHQQRQQQRQQQLLREKTHLPVINLSPGTATNHSITAYPLNETHNDSRTRTSKSSQSSQSVCSSSGKPVRASVIMPRRHRSRTTSRPLDSDRAESARDVMEWDDNERSFLDSPLMTAVSLVESGHNDEVGVAGTKVGVQSSSRYEIKQHHLKQHQGSAISVLPPAVGPKLRLTEHY